MSVKACIFDLDGTLLDTLEDLANSCNAALRAVGLPERSLDEVRAFGRQRCAQADDACRAAGK